MRVLEVERVDLENNFLDSGWPRLVWSLGKRRKGRGRVRTADAEADGRMDGLGEAFTMPKSWQCAKTKGRARPTDRLE